ncbi:fam-d protein [Plasmodium vinckei brucechwatti]|uniref:Fam-d protein n=1 Tax=Plasmodium vinckei brucechwatti TaxID=119398 RepID=A0A6V7S4G0_PLAVN|nr:fam-d protein [Plasmodium vinckei brucechwatti]
MKMVKIILSLFILAISANVKAANFQSEDPNNSQLISYDSVAQPTAILECENKKHYKYLDLINDVLGEQSTNVKYAYEGSDYHMVLTDFDISIDNDSHYVKKYFCKKLTEAIKIGTKFFIAYLKGELRYIYSRYMYKYDFENNYAVDLMDFAHDLKALIYDKFPYNYKHDLIKFRQEPENEKLKKKAKEFFLTLMRNSSLNIQGYFIKTRSDENFMYLNQDVSLYFNITIAPFVVKATYDFEFPEFEVIEEGQAPLKKS